jgi:hypothetical protein
MSENYTYPVFNINGGILGKLILAENDIPLALMDGEKFLLSGSYEPVTQKFISFFIIPEEVVEGR